MPLSPVEIERFGGLRLDRAPEEVGAESATDLSNVDVDVPGKLRPRAGLSFFDSDDTLTYGANPISRIVENPHTTLTWIATANATSIVRYHSGSVTVFSATVPQYGLVDLMHDGDAIWVTDEAGLRYLVPFSMSVAVPTSPLGGYMTLMRKGGRVVIAGSSAASATRSTRVNFGPLTALGTWVEWVDLPADQAITGVTSLGDLVIVFQETRAAVFYTTSTSGTGSPIFNYRMVDLGDRIAYTNPAGNPGGRFSGDGDAVYFAAGRGVYAFNGSSPPSLISAPLESEWDAGGWGFDQTVKVCATGDRVYVGGNTTSGATFVLDRATQEWTKYGVASSAMAPMARGALRSLYVGGLRLSTLSPALTTDYGAAIAWSYQSGKYPVSDRGKVAVTQTTSVTGRGTVAVKLDTETYTGTQQSVATGVSSDTEGFTDGLDQEGKLFQHRLSGTGPFEVSRLTHYVSHVKSGGSL